MAIVNISANTNLIREVKYVVSIHEYIGLDFKKKLEIKPDSVLIDKVELIPLSDVKEPPCKLSIIFHLNEPVSKEQEVPEVNELLGNILDYLSFEHNLKIGEVQKPLGIYVEVKMSLKHGISVEEVTRMEADIVNLRSNPYKRLYRAALQNTDYIASFMFLYSLLLEVLDDPNTDEKVTQITVDSFIRERCKDVYRSGDDRRSTRKVKNPRMETIYTWLRNQIGHTQVDSDFSYVSTMISAHLNLFAIIVKKAINEYS